MRKIFQVTFVGFAIAAIFAIFEFLYGTKLSGGDAGVTWLQEMISDLRLFERLLIPLDIKL